MREDDLVVQQVALFIQADHLASRPETRVDGHDALFPDRGGQQQLAQVLAEDPDRFNIRLRLRLLQDLSRNGRLQQALIGIVHGLSDLLRGVMGRIAVLLGVVIIDFLAALLRIGIDGNLQEALVLRPEHGEQVVRRNP